MHRLGLFEHARVTSRGVIGQDLCFIQRWELWRFWQHILISVEQICWEQYSREHHIREQHILEEQAGAELGQAQLKLWLGYTRCPLNFHRLYFASFKFRIYMFGLGGSPLYSATPSYTLPTKNHQADCPQLSTGHIWSISSCISTFPGVGVGGGGNNQT